MNYADFQKLLFLAWPQWVLLAGAFVCLLSSVIHSKKGFELSAGVAFLAYAVAGFGFWWGIKNHQGGAVALLSFSPAAYFAGFLLCLLGALTILFSYSYWRRQNEIIHEAFSLFLFATFGMALMVTTKHLLVFLFALEVLSLSLYVLTGLRRSDPRSSEAAFKYFLLGSVASAVFLLGAAFYYGISGSLSWAQTPPLSPMAATFQSPLLFWAVLLLMFGFVFKLAGIPLQFWSPDVYEGSPMPVTGFMASSVKVSVVIALLYIFVGLMQWMFRISGSNEYPLQLVRLFQGVSIATMLLANFAALRQRSLKRLLAYSSVAHAGYLLLGLAAYAFAPDRSRVFIAILFYLLTYSLSTLAAFGTLTLLSSRGKEIDSLSELDGLAQKQPWIAFCFSVFLISLAGIPPLAGFMGKYFLFSQVIAAGARNPNFYVLATVGIVSSAISLYYYLGPVVRMYFYPPESQELPVASRFYQVLVGVLALVILYWGILPGWTLQMLGWK